MYDEKGVPLVDIEAVSKRFGERVALHSVSLKLYPSEVVSLLGVNGAAKTTLSALIAGVHPPSEGTIRFRGRSVADDPVAYRRRVGYCPQRVHGDRIFTVREHIRYAARFFDIDESCIDGRIESVARSCGLLDALDRYPGELSGGYRQRFSFARALVHSPEVLILDEPTVALDPHVRRQLWELIAQLRDTGVSIVLTTHYLDEAEHLSDRICFLHHGSIRLCSTMPELRHAHGACTLEDIFLKFVGEQLREGGSL